MGCLGLNDAVESLGGREEMNGGAGVGCAAESLCQNCHQFCYESGGAVGRQALAAEGAVTSGPDVLQAGCCCASDRNSLLREWRKGFVGERTIS